MDPPSPSIMPEGALNLGDSINHSYDVTDSPPGTTARPAGVAPPPGTTAVARPADAVPPPVQLVPVQLVALHPPSPPTMPGGGLNPPSPPTMPGGATPLPGATAGAADAAPPPGATAGVADAALLPRATAGAADAAPLPGATAGAADALLPGTTARPADAAPLPGATARPADAAPLPGTTARPAGAASPSGGYDVTDSQLFWVDNRPYLVYPPCPSTIPEGALSPADSAATAAARPTDSAATARPTDSAATARPTDSAACVRLPVLCDPAAAAQSHDVTDTRLPVQPYDVRNSQPLSMNHLRPPCPSTMPGGALNPADSSTMPEGALNAGAMPEGALNAAMPEGGLNAAMPVRHIVLVPEEACYEYDVTDCQLFWMNKRPYLVHGSVGKGAFGEVYKVEMMLPVGMEVRRHADAGAGRQTGDLVLEEDGKVCSVGSGLVIQTDSKHVQKNMGHVPLCVDVCA